MNKKGKHSYCRHHLLSHDQIKCIIFKRLSKESITDGKRSERQVQEAAYEHPGLLNPLLGTHTAHGSSCHPYFGFPGVTEGKVAWMKSARMRPSDHKCQPVLFPLPHPQADSHTGTSGGSPSLQWLPLISAGAARKGLR